MATRSPSGSSWRTATAKNWCTTSTSPWRRNSCTEKATTPSDRTKRTRTCSPSLWVSSRTCTRSITLKSFRIDGCNPKSSSRFPSRISFSRSNSARPRNSSNSNWCPRRNCSTPKPKRCSQLSESQRSIRFKRKCWTSSSISRRISS